MIKKIQELVKELNVHRHNYYNLNKPTITDSQYDNMIDELSAFENECNYILSNSPTQTVGYEVISKLQKVEHPIPLKSLSKTKSIDEINQWRKNQDILAMLKADGLTNEIVYQNGTLIEGSTRGNSFIGELITHNCKTYRNLPKVIPFKGFLRLAGESIIHKDDFDKINSKLSDEDKYATPRNLVSGSCRQLNSKICSQREVYYYAFGILECDEELSDSKFEQFKWLNELGITTINHIKINKGENIEQYVDKLYQIAEETNTPIDGLVFSMDSVEYSKSLGETSHHPHHSVALKRIDLAETTQLKEIEWSVGRTGVITPVAIFDTVLLDNTEVSRASLHNLSIIEELELGIGDSVSIIKANQIIPQIEENFTRSNNIGIPKVCPVCGAITIIEQLNESKVLYCTNPNCSAKLLKKFSHFVSRDAMNIEGLSEQTLEKFINQGWLKTFDDIYNLDKYKSQIIKLEGFGSRSYTKLITNIEKSKKVKMQNFLYGLGIPNIGKGSSKIIAKYFNNDWFAFEKALLDGFKFTVLTDFGEVTNQSLHDWYNDENERKMWTELSYMVEFIKEEKKIMINTDNFFNGKKIYATGSFNNYKKDEIKQLLESLGATFASGYSKSLDCLIEGSLKSSSKVEKAKKDGIQVIGEDEFIRMINN